jgi:hypothetical protein
VLTWVEGEDVKEAEVVITGASFDGDSITYTTNAHSNTVGTLKAVSLFVDYMTYAGLFDEADDNFDESPSSPPQPSLKTILKQAKADQSR